MGVLLSAQSQAGLKGKTKKSAILKFGTLSNKSFMMT